MPQMRGPRTLLGLLRRRMGLTIFETAVIKLGVNVNTYKQWEYGMAHPKWDGQRRLEHFFCVPWQELVELQVFSQERIDEVLSLASDPIPPTEPPPLPPHPAI